MQLRSTTDLGQAVRGRRHELGLDQAELAARVGVSRQWIIALEQGKERAALGLVLRTLRALDLKIDVAPVGASVRTSTESGDALAIDLDDIIERARAPRGEP